MQCTRACCQIWHGCTPGTIATRARLPLMTLNTKDQMRVSGYAGKARSERTFTDEQMKDALHAAVAANGFTKPLSREAYQHYYEKNPGSPHPYTIIRRFDFWSDALKEAKLPYRKRGAYQTEFSPEGCIEALLKAREELGHLPSVGEYDAWWNSNSDGKFPSGSTIRLKWGTWRKACTEAASRVE